MSRLIDSDGVLLSPKTWAKVDERSLFSETDATGALLLLRDFDVLIYSWINYGRLRDTNGDQEVPVSIESCSFRFSDQEDNLSTDNGS